MAKTFQWEELLSEVAKRIPPQQYRAWIEPIRYLELTDRHLLVSAPTSFSQVWITDHYREVFREALNELYGLRLDLVVEIERERYSDDTSDSSAMLTLPHSVSSENDPSHSRDLAEHESNGSTGFQVEVTGNEKEPSLFDFAAHRNMKLSSSDESTIEAPQQVLEPVAAISVRDMSVPIVKTLGQPLDPKHTFETFVVGASNQFAHAAARAVAEQLATQYNPLFIYSDAGLGKTHLLHAIGNYALRLNPKAKICYISAEKFVNDLIDSIQNGRMSQFRERYRDSYDILLMDDIQFIAGKDRTQEEFFHTFNALHSSRRQIVVTSDKFPKDIPGLEERIRTRFEWGLIADIQPPEIETRIAILRAKAEMDDIFLPNDVALFLASNIKSNIRELEGSLLRLGAQASLSGSEISLDLAKQLLRNMIKEPSNTITPDAIQDAVARHFAIKVSDLKSRERSRRVSLPRQIAMYLIRKYCDKSYPDIGILLGGKDHSTVLHGVKAIASDIEKDPEIRRHVEEIQNSL
ncbi:MAG: chromosomal replication initiator protein DnaA [Bdellovibrionota bacterium]